MLVVEDEEERPTDSCGVMYDQVVQVTADPPDAVEFDDGEEGAALMDTTEATLVFSKILLTYV